MQLGVPQWMKTGIPQFDQEFIIKGSDSERIMELISNPSIRLLIESQPKLKFGITKQRAGEKGFNASWTSLTVGKAPASNGDVQVELIFQEKGVIKDIERLKAIFDLFYQTLDHLERAGAIKPVN